MKNQMVDLGLGSVDSCVDLSGLWNTTGVQYDSYFYRTVKVSAALDVTPLFIIAGTVIPIADPRIMTVNNATNSSVITWQNLKVCKIIHIHCDMRDA